MSPFSDMQGPFDVVVADPPWRFRSYTALDKSNWTRRRDAEKHYPVMGWGDIAALPVGEIAAKNCHLFLWVTGPCLPLAFKVMEAWGFRYSAVAFTWIKLKRSHNQMQLRVLPTADSDLHVGLGMTTRKNAEFCLLGRRGSPKRHARNVREVILAPVREHSRKPMEFRERVEAYAGAGSRIIELFARETRPGWIPWGNESGKFDQAA